jgi:hypothetical protein
VRGDAERGLLQPLIVRPVGRRAYLAGRLLAAAAVSAGYVVVLFGACVVIIGLLGWWPDRIVAPTLALAGAAVVLAAIALLGSVLLPVTANGIAVFMVFGAGLARAARPDRRGPAVRDPRRHRRRGAWVLPFEALYQHGLSQLTADVEGLTETVVQLGPFGGAQAAGALLWPYVVVYVAAVFATADGAVRPAGPVRRVLAVVAALAGVFAACGSAARTRTSRLPGAPRRRPPRRRPGGVCARRGETVDLGDRRPACTSRRRRRRARGRW